MSDNEKPVADTTSTSVSITLNAKPLGVDAFVKLEETITFTEPVTAAEAIFRRDELSAILTEQALSIVSETAKTVKDHLAANPVGHVSVHQVQAQPAPVAPQAGAVAPAGTGAAAVAAVANGAVAGGGDWRNAVDRFDPAKTVRYLSTASYSSDQMKQAVYAWIAGQGYNPAFFEVWDERRDAEAGKPISSVCNIKVGKDFAAAVPADLIRTPSGGNKAIARAKFNHDGSLYVYWTKEVETASKYGALDGLRGQ